MAPGDAEQFLSPTYAGLRRFGGAAPLRDLDVAVEVLARAAKARGTVVVFGDYDVDGVCGTALACDALTRTGARTVPMLPHRERDGYGLQEGSVAGILVHKPQAVLTVDNGTASGPAIAALKRAGIAVVVADHHEVHNELPPADAVVNGKRADETGAFRTLCATGVAFRIAESLYDRFGVADGQEKWLLDLAALATVCDMVPLVGDNRAIVRFGLRTLSKTRRPGLTALLQSSGSVGNGSSGILNAEHLGFRLGPRLNAAGRIVHAQRALELVQTDSPSAAASHAQHLEDLNRERQALTRRVVEEARIAAEEFADAPSLVLASSGWPRGVCGLAAGKIAEEFQRPTFVLEKADPCVGSGRSVPGVDISAALASMREIFVRAGGHAAAAGCTIAPSALGDFRTRLNEYVSNARPDGPQAPTRTYDLTITLADVNLGMLDVLTQLEPFGVGNPKPTFRIDGCTVSATRPIGADGKHLSLVLTQAGEKRRAVAWGKADALAELSPGEQVDVLAHVRENDWRGTRSAEIEVVDVAR